jgi:PAS domain S-box-containing protein
MRLLIADDDPSTRRLLRTYVSSQGHEIVECADGLDALAVLQGPHRPAVAILDWMMPGLDGPDVCRRLRAFDREVYVILLTSRTASSDVVRALSAGADEYLSKTTHPLELRARLEAALRVAALRDQVARQMRELRVLFKCSPCAMWVADATTHQILEVNEAACALYGYPPEAFLRLSESDLAVADPPALTLALFPAPASEQVPCVSHRCRDGRQIEVQLATHSIVFRGHQAQLVVAEDVTRRLLVERLTRLQLGVTRTLAEAATPAEAWPVLLELLGETLGLESATVRDRDGIGAGVTAWWHRTTREGGVELPDETPTRIVPVVVGTTTLATIRLYARTTSAMASESLALLPILSSQIAQFLIRKQSEAALQQALANLRALVAGSPLPIATYDRHGVVQMWNAAAERTFGWSETEVLGHDNPVVPPAKREESDRFRECVLLGEEITGVQVKRQTKDGRLLDVSLSTAPLRGPGGFTTGVMAIFQDITKEKAAERDVRDAHTETERLFSAMASVLIGLTAGRRVTRWNSAATATFHCEAPDALGRMLRDCPIQWDATLLDERIAECQRLRARVDLHDFAYVIDGRPRFLDIVLTSVAAGREAGGVVLLASDVTEYRLLQTQLAQAQKLESIGQLAAGIAHEINTPMQYIGDNVRFLCDSWPAVHDVLACASRLDGGSTGELAAALARADLGYVSTEVPHAIAQTLEGIDRISGIVRAMRELSHPGTGERVPIDVNRVIETTINVARHEWKNVCEIVTDLSPALPAVPCLPGDLNQVILNLLVNAAQAIADAGPLDQTQTHAQARIAIETQHSGDEIEITVTDTGPGIPDAIRDRVFDPFFTTKEVGRGTGQGLAIAHNIVVHKHQGRIWFDTQAGAGTTFHVRLPLHPLGTQHGYIEADTVR